MKEIRNLDGKLVCCLDRNAKLVEIKVKDCVTLIKMSSEGIIEVINTKKEVA